MRCCFLSLASVLIGLLGCSLQENPADQNHHPIEPIPIHSSSISCEKENNPCNKGMISWDALDEGESRVCSGAWEYKLYTKCHVAHESCGDPICQWPLCCQNWGFGHTSDTHISTETFEIANRLICSMNGGCSYVPDFNAARSACVDRLVDLQQQYTSTFSRVTSANYSEPTLVSNNAQVTYSEFQCSFLVNYQVANRDCSAATCGCFVWGDPVCEKHGPDYCPDAEERGVRYSAHGLTEEQLLASYDDAEYHTCTSCEHIADTYERYLCLTNRLNGGPLPPGLQGAWIFNQMLIQLKLTLEFGSLELQEKFKSLHEENPDTVPPVREQMLDTVSWYIDYPNVDPSCGISSSVVGTCGSFQPLDAFLSLCNRLTSFHAREISPFYASDICDWGLCFALRNAAQDETNEMCTTREDWEPYIIERLGIACHMNTCKGFDIVPCTACSVKILE